MASKVASDDDIRTLYNSGIPVASAAEQLGLTQRNFLARVAKLRASGAVSAYRKPGNQSWMAQPLTSPPVLPEFPDDDIPVERILDTLVERSGKRLASAQARQWFEIKIPDEPFGLLVWGDPHLDNNGTNWALLREHVEIGRQPGIYSINIGDTLDNWAHGSRLIALYAHSDQSVETARKLAKWFLEDAGLTWLVWLLGNHDLWPGHNNLKLMCPKAIHMADWGARFVVRAGDSKWRVWASHNFSGHSMWNTLHGPQRAAHTKHEADLYLAGHTHNWAIHQEESASRGFTYWLVRARGYKHIDEHADKLGHDPQRGGSSILVVCNPADRNPESRTMAFSCPEAGTDYLNFLRTKSRPRGRRS